MTELNERQTQAVKFLENVIARCYQEKMTLSEVLIQLLHIMSPQLEQEGLKLFIGTPSDVVYRTGLTLEARRFIQERDTTIEVELDA